MYIDYYYLVLVLPCVILSIIAQSMVTSTFKKYSKLMSQRGFSAASVTRKILDLNGLTHITVENINGSLTDHYDPSKKVIRLSDTVYSSTSVAAIGVAAHEAGHAIQHSKSYIPLKIRNSIFPVVSFSSRLAIPLAMLGLILQIQSLLNFGILLFSAVVIFQLITLPVEFNASARAINILGETQILAEDELKYTSKVLRAAALTYVASTLTSLMSLLRLILISRSRRD